MISTQPIVRCERNLVFQCTGVADWNVERHSTNMEIDTNMCSKCLPKYISYVANDELRQLTIRPVEYIRPMEYTCQS